MRIKYITFDAWWDTDITIIPELYKKFDVDVYCLNYFRTSKYPHKTVPKGVGFYQKTQRNRTSNIKSIICSFRFFFKSYFSDRSKDDVYFVTPVNDLWLSLLFLLFLPKSRTILSFHNYLEHGDSNSFSMSLFGKIRDLYFKKFSFFHFYSKYQMDLFKNDYKDKQAFFTEMPPKDFGPGQLKPRDDNRIVLLFFGLIRDYKRLDWLIKAANSLHTNKFKIVIAGKISDEDKKKYNNLIGNNTSYETHYGFVSNEDIPNYFVNSDFLVLPYDSATQSGPSLIAINYGIPIIASDVPAFKNIVSDGKTGFFFKTDLLGSLVEVLNKVSKMSREEIDKMKDAQKAFKFSYISSNRIDEIFSQFTEKTLHVK